MEKIKNINKISKSQHIAQVRSVFIPSQSAKTDSTVCKKGFLDPGCKFSDKVAVDPDGQLSVQQRNSFKDILNEFDNVFTPNFGVYNDKSGRIRANVNIGPVEPPPRKGKLPFYNQTNLQKLQDEADKLKACCFS